jgi:predicted nucleic acid-binding protein
MSAKRLRYLIDTNVLLRSIEPAHPHHQAAQNALRSLAESAEMFCTSQNLIEAYVVMTRQKAERGLGMTPKSAAANVARFQAIAELLPDKSAIFAEWQRLAEQYAVAGMPSYDARLVAAMKMNRLTHILTFNAKDFRRYETGENISAIEPASIATA